MSKKMMSVIAAGILLAGAATYASDAWKDKDFQNWDQKDVQKILSDSPWSKKIQIGSAGSAGNGSMTRAVSGGRPVNGGGAGSPDIPGTQEPSQQMNLIVSWFSSRTIREAMARKKELAGTSQEDARKILAEEPSTYEIAVSGPALTVFGEIQEDDLKEHSYLVSKTAKEKTAPAGVIVERAQNDQPVAIIFEFAKTTESGAPTIVKNEKGVEFFTQSGKIPIRIQFDLTKMTDKLGTDY